MDLVILSTTMVEAGHQLMYFFSRIFRADWKTKNKKHIQRKPDDKFVVTVGFSPSWKNLETLFLLHTI